MKTIGNLMAFSGVLLATTFGFGLSSLAQSRDPAVPDHIHNYCSKWVSQMYIPPGDPYYERESAYIQCAMDYTEQEARQQGLLDTPTNYRRSIPQCGADEILVGNSCRNLRQYVPQVD